MFLIRLFWLHTGENKIVVSVKQTGSQEENQLVISVIEDIDDGRLKQNGACGYKGITNWKNTFERK